MARNLPLIVTQAVNAESTDRVFLDLLEVSHPNLDRTFRAVNNLTDITSNGNVYSAFPFTLIKPADSVDQVPILQVLVADVNRLLVEQIRGVVLRSNVSLAMSVLFVEARNPDTVLQRVDNFNVHRISYTNEEISLEAQPHNFITEAFPAQIFSPNRFPGLF